METVMAAPAASIAAASFPFRHRYARNLIRSSPRPVFLPPRVASLSLRSIRLALYQPARRHGNVVVATSAAGMQQFGENENPYEILGISPLDGFDQVKMAYKRRRNDAEGSRDVEYLMKLERAYDTVMMEQLLNRKKGVAYGSIQVSKDIKYADNQPIVSWGPRYSRSTVKDLRVNVVISTAFIMYISTLCHADWKPLQFLCFLYFYRILEKLKAAEPVITPIYNGYTGLANFSHFVGQYIPSVVYNFQELIVTTASSVLLCILASYYR